jgi:hypothetical protein
MFSPSIAPPYRSTQMNLQYNYGIRITHVTSDGLLSICRTYHALCSVSPFINRNLCAALFIPTHTLVSTLTRFGVYWWCHQTLKCIRTETYMWVGINNVVHKSVGSTWWHQMALSFYKLAYHYVKLGCLMTWFPTEHLESTVRNVFVEDQLIIHKFFVKNVTKPHNKYAANNNVWKTYDICWQHVSGMIYVLKKVQYFMLSVDRASRYISCK